MPQAKVCGWPLEAGQSKEIKGARRSACWRNSSSGGSSRNSSKEVDFPLEPPERNAVLLTPCF